MEIKIKMGLNRHLSAFLLIIHPSKAAIAFAKSLKKIYNVLKKKESYDRGYISPVIPPLAAL